MSSDFRLSFGNEEIKLPIVILCFKAKIPIIGMNFLITVVFFLAINYVVFVVVIRTSISSTILTILVFNLFTIGRSSLPIVMV